MGQQLPLVSNPIPPLQRSDQFESKYVQRIKQTPFIDAELYNTDPLIFIDPLGPSLAQLIKPRLGTKQLFPQEEIEKLIICVLSGLKDLQENDFFGHGDVCLDSIYYSKKEKSFKLMHPIFNEQSGYLLAKHGKRFTALAPEQLSALSEDSEESEISFKSDIFMFGIALCEVCSLTPSSDIYCPDTYSIFHLQIQKRLQLIEEYYSRSIAEAVSDCLIYDPQSRPLASHLLERFQMAKRRSIVRDPRPLPRQINQ